MKRIGPELKKPDLKKVDVKVPRVLRDLYRDLRDRRLLPLVALLLVAIVAAPFLLSSSPPATPPPPVAPAGPAAAAASAPSASLTVVKAAPGLREPSKRLSRLHAKDPFEQQYTNAPVSRETVPVTSTSVTSESSSTDVVAEGTVEAPPSSPGESGGSSLPGNSGSSPGGNSAAAGEIVFYSFAIDVKIVRAETKADGTTERDEPQVRERVLPSTVLPAEKQQVVTYLGVSPKTRKPLFLVSTDVTSVLGDAKCVTGSDSCQLLELEEKFPETFVYGANQVRYKITVLKVEPVATGHS